MSPVQQEAYQGLTRSIGAAAVVLFAAAGSLRYWEAWLYLAIVLSSTLWLTAYLARHDPALLERRLHAGSAAEKLPAQKRIQLVNAVFLLAMLVTAGLDFRFGWSRVPWWIVVSANVLSGVALLATLLVFRVNTYAAGIVQVVPGQSVVDTGPYALVRHPMYSLSAVLFFTTPLALGSCPALVCSLLVTAGLAVRLAGEERHLIEHLPGYTAYRTKVRWRLIPLLWGLLASIAAAQSPEQRAVGFLTIEVPRWYTENGCFSCHNNGDAARALYLAKSLGYSVPDAAFTNTLGWLKQPNRWDSNRGNPAFSDKKLARVQFAASLSAAIEAGLIRDRRPLLEAASALLSDQDADGSWQIDTGSSAGSPATYGATLATYIARQVLRKAGATRFAAAIQRADGWLAATIPVGTLDAAAKLLAFPDSPIGSGIDPIVRAQNSDGGWGPHPRTPSEPFDTAVVLLALRGASQHARTREAIVRGRAWLLHLQQPDGAWPETTRPPGARSYAQQMSTTGWATLALLSTDSKH